MKNSTKFGISLTLTGLLAAIVALLEPESVNYLLLVGGGLAFIGLAIILFTAE